MTLTREQSRTNAKNGKTKVTPELQRAKDTLRLKGWSYRRVAPLLGVTHVHLAFVLNGVRRSRRLLRKIEEVPFASKPQ